MKDLLEFREALPKEVQDILNRYETEENTYGTCMNLVGELAPLGYAIDFDLDAVPFNLRKLPPHLFAVEVVTKDSHSPTKIAYLAERASQAIKLCLQDFMSLDTKILNIERIL